MNTRNKALFVEFSDGGDCVYFPRHSTSTGYGTPERPHAAEIDEGLEIPDGIIALDTRPAIATDEGFSWVFRGPMLDPDLPAGTSDQCPPPEPLMAVAMMTDRGNAFGGLLNLQGMSRARGETRGPLDSVSIPEYVAGWVKRGARVGVYRGGSIVWND
jgi:hypothetical protein